MVLLDASIVTVALPTIQRDLHASLSELQWVVDAYTLPFAVLLLTAGTLGDRFGRKRLFLVGLTIFTFGSALCGLAPTFGWLIAGRVIQGVGGAALCTWKPFCAGICISGAARTCPGYRDMVWSIRYCTCRWPTGWRSADLNIELVCHILY